MLKITAVHETGRVLNPVAFYGQLEGGVVYGFGETVMTETVYDESGRVTNPSFADMKLPTVRDLPELNEIVLESDVGDGPYAVRGIGEHTNIMTAPAIANAIEDAVGVRITSLPITAEKVYAALQGKGERGVASTREYTSDAKGRCGYGCSAERDRLCGKRLTGGRLRGGGHRL